MQVIPAIDLKGGLCVRLTEGRAESVKVYDRDPIEVACGYERAGARRIHVVDLDRAFLHASSGNQETIRRIATEVDIPIEVGGGLRSLEDIRVLLRSGGARFAIVGTLAVEQPAVLVQAIAEFGESIIVGIDARGREVATRGWTDAARMDAFELARRVADAGAKRIIYTDIGRDGRLEGPNFELTCELALRSGLKITASGGVSSLEDIERMCELEADGVDSVIVGKALYEGRFTLEEAIAAASTSTS
ncbi:MAG TPA: 1-(5-phosphoribosyl)-5-[(5-phosphoribosylamino)methylideneamino]imidazole-4-carboxamide isomerase [Blastocatellia bacterium]|nr:1-(5-phosphoribosyl)-5-[(5-phosphoribosylamino)methylideneamino]imidazole-4-carboxamide isomerase [Blastocatellia bacterium]